MKRKNVLSTDAYSTKSQKYDELLELKTSGDWTINPKTNNPYDINFNVTRLNT